jgi:plasmid stabilization system protein ParE
LSFDVHVRRAAELDIAEAQLWYETQRIGLGREFYSEVSSVIDRLAHTPLVYQIVHQEVRRALVPRFPYLIWYRVLGSVVTVLACTHGKQNPSKTISRLR